MRVCRPRTSRYSRTVQQAWQLYWQDVIECTGCLEKVPNGGCGNQRQYAMRCGHDALFCKGCTEAYLQSVLRDSSMLGLTGPKCFFGGCECDVPMGAAKALLSEKEYTKLRQLVNDVLVSRGTYRWCPKPGYVCSTTQPKQMRHPPCLIHTRTPHTQVRDGDGL